MTLDNETEVLDETTEEQVDELETVEEEQEEGQEAATEGETTEAEADEVVVTIGDEPAPEEEEIPATAAPWIKDLRKRNQETVKENRELKKQLDALKASPAEQAVQLGEKPTLETCDFDTDVFEEKLTQWHERKREHAEQERKKQEAGAKAQAEWQEKVNAYEKAKAAIKVPDMAEAEADAFEFLSVTQRGVALDAVENPALVIYALGKNPKRLQALAAISNPIKFAVALRDLEKDMKVTPRKTAPLPESTVRGNAPVGGTDSNLERLKVEARRTGDYSKVSEYNRKQAAKKSGA